MTREKQIVRTSLVGIGVNLVLVAFKAAVGAATNSIAIVLDAVNNLGDALSSTVTIVGTKLAARRPDKDHPYGHGRIEYITAMAVAAIVLAAGVAALRESAVKTLHPPETDYSTLSLGILAVGVAAKLFVGRHVRAVGRSIGSSALVASGSDAFFDAILTFATILAGVASMLWGLRLEGVLGAVISLVIVKAGLGMLFDTAGDLIGRRPDSALASRVKGILLSDVRIRGVYDLSLHNYGPLSIVGSVHVEVADDMTAREIHTMTRHLAGRIYSELGVVLSIGIYSSGDASPAIAAIRARLEALVAARPEVLQVHGFLGDEAASSILFDLVIDLAADAPAVRDALLADLRSEYPGWTFDAVLDADAA